MYADKEDEKAYNKEYRERRVLKLADYLLKHFHLKWKALIG